MHSLTNDFVIKGCLIQKSEWISSIPPIQIVQSTTVWQHLGWSVSRYKADIPGILDASFTPQIFV